MAARWHLVMIITCIYPLAMAVVLTMWARGISTTGIQPMMVVMLKTLKPISWVRSYVLILTADRPTLYHRLTRLLANRGSMRSGHLAFAILFACHSIWATRKS